MNHQCYEWNESTHSVIIYDNTVSPDVYKCPITSSQRISANCNKNCDEYIWAHAEGPCGPIWCNIMSTPLRLMNDTNVKANIHQGYRVGSIEVLNWPTNSKLWIYGISCRPIDPYPIIFYWPIPMYQVGPYSIHDGIALANIITHDGFIVSANPNTIISCWPMQALHCIGRYNHTWQFHSIGRSKYDDTVSANANIALYQPIWSHMMVS
jgi:hypothetical protein